MFSTTSALTATNPFFKIMTYNILVHSFSLKAKYYVVRVDPEQKTVTCECPGFRFTGHCRHIKIYKRLIKAILHEKAGVAEQKELS